MMHKIFIITSISIILVTSQVKSLNIDCEYFAANFSHSIKLPTSYFCRVNIINPINGDDLTIRSIKGSHLNNKTNEDVLAFQVHATTSYCFKGVEKFFKNLKALAYQKCSLKEIHNEDLKPFPNIVDLYLNNNDIEVIEGGLFDYNPALVLIQLKYNKITHIHADVFDHLDMLTHLFLGDNTCKVLDSSNAASIKGVIKQLKKDNLCQNSEFMEIHRKLDILENNMKPMNQSVFKEQLDKLKYSIKNSKFYKYSSFDDRLENIKITAYAGYCRNYNEGNHHLQLEDMSNYEDNSNLSDFQNKINALSAKVSSIANIVEQLEDKLENLVKKINIKVIVDV